MDLSLLSKLKAADSANLVLLAQPGDKLQYFLVSRSIAYDIICTGYMPGQLDGRATVFDIRMSSIIPLVEKGYQLMLEYLNGNLCFVSEDRRIKVTPSYVTTTNSDVDSLIERYLNFSDALESKALDEERLRNIENDIAALEATEKHLASMNLYGGPPSDPFTPFPEKDNEKEERLRERLDELKKTREKLNSNIQSLAEINLSVFLPLAGAASRTHTLVDMCSDYAVVSLRDSYLLQKGHCPIQSIQGQLLYTLLRNGGGKGFYQFEQRMVYLSQKKQDTTAVMIAPYLPGSAIDPSIVTKGITEERYELSLRGVLSVTSLVRSQFTKISMNLGEHYFLLENDIGEHIRIEFDIEDAKTLELMKMTRENTFSNISMATLDIPRDIQAMLSLFRDKLTIFVKRRKVIFKSEDLYLVFGR